MNVLLLFCSSLKNCRFIIFLSKYLLLQSPLMGDKQSIRAISELHFLRHHCDSCLELPDLVTWSCVCVEIS